MHGANSTPHSIYYWTIWRDIAFKPICIFTTQTLHVEHEELKNFAHKMPVVFELIHL